jgi:hypothetical protein
MSLVLGNGPSGRRTGLSRNIGGSLLQTINPAASQNREMPPRAITKAGTAAVVKAAAKKLEDEENIYRPPDSSDDDFDAGDIQRTDFESTSEQREEQKRKDNDTVKHAKKGIATANGNLTTNTRPRRGKLPQASSQSNDGFKRKSQEEVKPIGADMLDAHGRPKKKKPRISTYGARKAYKRPPAISSGSLAILQCA